VDRQANKKADPATRKKKRAPKMDNSLRGESETLSREESTKILKNFPQVHIGVPSHSQRKKKRIAGLKEEGAYLQNERPKPVQPRRTKKINKTDSKQNNIIWGKRGI